MIGERKKSCADGGDGDRVEENSRASCRELYKKLLRD
jgi:hypothetical protein